MWTVMIIIGVSISYIVSSILTYGLTLADTGCRQAAVFFSVLGPFGLLISFLGSGFGRRGLRFRMNEDWFSPQDRKIKKLNDRVKELETFLDRLGIEKP